MQRGRNQRQFYWRLSVCTVMVKEIIPASSARFICLKLQSRVNLLKEIGGYVQGKHQKKVITHIL